MDEALLKALNPGVDFAVAGDEDRGGRARARTSCRRTVARIEVDKAKRQVRAYGDGDVLLAVYPATVGSSERPAPSGEWAVRTIAPNPTYTYDPTRLTFGKASQGKLTIKAGPEQSGGLHLDRPDQGHLRHPRHARPAHGRQDRQPRLRAPDQLGRAPARQR